MIFAIGTNEEIKALAAKVDTAAGLPCCACVEGESCECPNHVDVGGGIHAPHWQSVTRTKTAPIPCADGELSAYPVAEADEKHLDAKMVRVGALTADWAPSKVEPVAVAITRK